MPAVESAQRFRPYEMRIPLELRDCTCFLCVQEGEGWAYRGTAFVIHVPFGPEEDAGLRCLVTARHNLRLAAGSGQLHVRINRRDGGSSTVAIKDEWFQSSDDLGADAALCPMPDHGGDLAIARVHRDLFLDPNEVHVGDDVVITGLFSPRSGTDRNLPVVRQGIVAAMPSEPFVDAMSGLSYGAYLIECRSFGGLSGSPVFCLLPDPTFSVSADLGDFVPGSLRVGKPQGRIGLMGFIRGHFDIDQETPLIQVQQHGEVRAFNMGIAIVTPITEVLDILNREDFQDLLRERRREHAHLRDATLDDPERPGQAA